jgi:ribosomal protein L37AE/L43A
MQECQPNKHKARDNKLGITWCVLCGRLFTKPSGKPLKESDKIITYASKTITNA